MHGEKERRNRAGTVKRKGNRTGLVKKEKESRCNCVARQRREGKEMGA